MPVRMIVIGLLAFLGHACQVQNAKTDENRPAPPMPAVIGSAAAESPLEDLSEPEPLLMPIFIPIEEEDIEPMRIPAEEYPTALDREEAGWHERVGEDLGVWISVPRQELLLFEAGRVTWRISCATASAGVGARLDTNQTPPGWHVISRKIGDNEAEGRVFRARQATREIWRPGMETSEDLVLTRIFIMDGLEPGVNQGRDAEGFVVDSRERYIYIHGTNDEANLGTPSSKGCIRVSNRNAVELYERVPVGTLLYIDPGE